MLDTGSEIGDPEKTHPGSGCRGKKKAPDSESRSVALSAIEFASHRQNCDKCVDKLDDGEDDLGLGSVRVKELALLYVLIHKGSKMYHKNTIPNRQ
jgi:hypothetical protein